MNNDKKTFNFVDEVFKGTTRSIEQKQEEESVVRQIENNYQRGNDIFSECNKIKSVYTDKYFKETTSDEFSIESETKRLIKSARDGCGDDYTPENIKIKLGTDHQYIVFDVIKKSKDYDILDAVGVGKVAKDSCIVLKGEEGGDNFLNVKEGDYVIIKRGKSSGESNE